MKIEKVKVNTTSRKLNAKYTMQIMQEAKAKIGDAAYDELAKILQKEIDREILEDLKMTQLEIEGWIKIPIQPLYKLYALPYDQRDWLEDNMTDEYVTFNKAILFKSHDDAVLYSLKWSSR